MNESGRLVWIEMKVKLEGKGRDLGKSKLSQAAIPAPKVPVHWLWMQPTSTTYEQPVNRGTLYRSALIAVVPGTVTSCKGGPSKSCRSKAPHHSLFPSAFPGDPNSALPDTTRRNASLPTADRPSFCPDTAKTCSPTYNPADRNVSDTLIADLFLP